MTTKENQIKITVYSMYDGTKVFNINKITLTIMIHILNAISSINERSPHCDKIYIELPITLTDVNDPNKQFNLIAYIYRYGIIVAIDNIEYRFYI